MSLHVYNTLHNRKEEFVPIIPGHVKMYVCGVTVYDYCHVGHARSAIVFDVIRNYLRYKGYDVLFVKNFTDVDDKIIKRAQEEKISTQEVAEKYIQAHDNDFGVLGVQPADITPKATEHIDDMQRLVKTLVNKDMAYEVDGDVYFAVKTFPGYGKLSGRNVDDLQSGSRIEVDARKRDPLDFALWKASKPGEPSWESPWGPGRPGWHIECSAMARKYLGDTFDIHGGGKDLIFPHHENEIAQSEGSSGKPPANYWLHNGFLNINQEKMSKSLGNFFTIREVLQQFSPETIRFLMISTHYRSPLDYSEERLNEAVSALKRFHNTFHDVERLGHTVVSQTNEPLPGEADQYITELPERIAALKLAFEEAMDDDFNTAAAIGCLFDMLKAINSTVRTLTGLSALSRAQFQPLADAIATVRRLGQVLGLQFAVSTTVTDKDQALLDDIMALLLEIRKEARAEKNWALADRVRDGLAQLGIQVKDHPGGTSSWERSQ